MHTTKPFLKLIFVMTALTILLIGCQQTPTGTGIEKPKTLSGILEKINQTGELHVGYGVYPPYTIEDPNTQKVSGFSVDIIEHIAKELKCKVVWHRLNWNTMSADLKRGEFDVIADPIFQTIPRAPEFSFSSPYAYFADGIAVVRKGEKRFKSFEDLDQEGIIINVGQGQASEALTTARFRKADIQPVSASTDNMQIFAGVLSGRADVAVADLPNAKRFVDEHPGEVEALWMDNPPAYMPAGFALRPTDTKGAEFFSVAIQYLETTGILDGIAAKYDLPSVTKTK